MSSNQDQNQDRSVGVIDRFTYVSEDRVFGVASFEVDDGSTIKINGNIGAYPEGAYLEIFGAITHNVKYKEDQFVVTLSMPAEPTASPVGLANFLSANFKHIGKVSSAKIVKHFGDLTIITLDESPDAIDQVKGLNKLMKKSIKEDWGSIRESHRGIRSIILAMHDERIGKQSIAKATQVFRHMMKRGVDVHARVLASPYQFFEEIDVGFIKADKIALRLGYPNDGIERLVYGTLYQLHSNLRSGDCMAAEDIVIGNAISFLNIDRGAAQDSIKECMKRGLIFPCDLEGKDYLMPDHLHSAEEMIVDSLRLLFSMPSSLDIISIEMALKEAQRNIGIDFNEQQTQGIRNALENNISIITGGPGTGKTTTLNGLVHALKGSTHKDPDIALVAPTGKAAKRMEESTGLTAKTIHRELIAADQGGRVYIEADLVVVDEASMIDTELFARLLEKIRPGARLVIIGDRDQLPSIGPGRVLGDIIDSAIFPITRLKRAYRFEDGFIKRNAANIIEGKEMVYPDANNPTDSDDCFFVEVNQPQDSDYGKSMLQVIAERVVRMHVSHIPAKKNADPLHDVQTLVPMRVGALGADALNLMIRDALNPLKGQRTIEIFKGKAGADPGQVESRSMVFRTGDKIMQTANNYDLDVFNGDVGFIQKIHNKEKKADVYFGDKLVSMNVIDMQDLDLAYAMTIHKSQGSEYQYVVMPIAQGHSVMLERATIYTGITRAKSMLVMLGQSKALIEGISREKTSIRMTGLKKRLITLAA